MADFSTDAQKAQLLLPVLAAAGITRSGARGARYWNWGACVQEDDLLPLCLDLGRSIVACAWESYQAAPVPIVVKSPIMEPEKWREMSEAQRVQGVAHDHWRAALKASDYLQSYDGALAVIRWAAALLDRQETKGQGVV